MVCKYCGAQIENDQAFCPNCGQTVSVDETPDYTQAPDYQQDAQWQQNDWQDPNAWQQNPYNNAWQQNGAYGSKPSVLGGNLMEDGAWFAAAASLASWLISVLFSWIYNLILNGTGFYGVGFGIVSALFSILRFAIPIGICVGLFFIAFSKKYQKNIFAELPLAFLPYVCYSGGSAVSSMFSSFFSGILPGTAGNVISVILGILVQLAVAAGGFFLVKIIIKKKEESQNQY